MSIAATSNSFVAAVRDRAPVAPLEATNAARGATGAQPEGGRRHDLVGAMNQVLGIEAEQSRSEAQAVFRFAHSLMHELRSIEGGAERDGHGRGHAWGRQVWSDLAQRIDALATAAAAPASAEAPAETVTPLPPPATPPVVTAAPPLLAQAPLPELPPQPKPVTTASVAVHLMQVPSSRLLEAYAALRQALGEQSATPTVRTDRAELAAFLERLSDELAPGASAALPSGSVLNLTA